MHQSLATKGYDVSRANAHRHGVLAKPALLPWEDEGEFDGLLEAFIADYAPRGQTERYLVTELAGIVWRRHRLSLAEGALNRRGLSAALNPYGSIVLAATAHLPAPPGGLESAELALRGTPEETAAELAAVIAAEADIRRALAMLDSGGAAALDAALDQVPERYRGKAMRARNPDAVARILRDSALAQLAARRWQLEVRPLVRAQAIAEAFAPERHDTLVRYETHLDRKFQRTLAMLLRLQDLRRADAALDPPTTS